MRSRSSLALVLAGCNRLLGLADVTQRDAAYFDARIDAPFACPPFGEVPHFAHGSQLQVSQQDCFGLSTSDDGRALATCDERSPRVSEGAPDALAPAPGLQGDANTAWFYPRIGPEGDVATIIYRNLSTGMFEATLVHRDATSWSVTSSLLPGTNVFSASGPSRGPNAHVIVDFDAINLHELVYNGSSWDDVRTFQLANYASMIQMSGDGLRIWWYAKNALQYADRPTVDDAFVERGALPGTELFSTGYITQDCSNVYFWALDRVWSAPRI
jgi:hypothetical protein